MKRAAGLSILVLVSAAVAGVVLGASLFTAHYAGALSYLSDDPMVCTSCHIMREHFDGWQKASHHAHATCNDCHLPEGLFAKYWAKAKNGYRHAKAFTLQDFHEPIRIHPENAKILNRNCLRCHQDLVREVTAHAGAEGEDLLCVRCHTQVGHGPPR
jgi:cytochrome c nitrite reductase small subunit